MTEFGHQLTVTGEEISHEEVAGHTHDGPIPGSTCPGCKRRVPYPKKPTSPTTRPIAYRVPLDEYDAHLEVIDAVAELLGVKEEPYHRFKALSYALACVLQGARLEETGG